MNKKIYVYLTCIVSAYSSTDFAELGFGGMLGDHFPGYEAFMQNGESLSDSEACHSASNTPRKPFGALSSNLPTPKPSPKKQGLTYDQRLLDGSFDCVVTETPKPSPQKPILSYPQCSSDSPVSSLQGISPILSSGSGTSDYVTRSDSASDKEAPSQQTAKGQDKLVQPPTKEDLILMYNKERSYLTGVKDLDAWLSLTYEIANLQYKMLNNEEYINVMIGAYNMIHLGGAEYESAKKELLIKITDEMYDYIDDYTLLQDPDRVPFPPEYLVTFYRHVDFLLFNHYTFEERISAYRKLIIINVQMRKQHRIDLYNAWIDYHECMLKINWQISAYEAGQPDSGVIEDVKVVFSELEQRSKILWNHLYCTRSEKVELAFNLSRVSFYLDDIESANNYRDFFNQWVTLADEAKKNQLDVNIQKLIDKERGFQQALEAADSSSFWA